MEFLKLPERRFLPPQWSLVLSLLAVPFLLGAVSIILAFHLGVPILAISPPPSICSVPAEHAVPSPSGLPRHPLITIEPPLEPHPTSSAVNVSDVLLGPFITAAESMRPEEVLCNITKPCTDCFLTAIWAELRRGDDPDTVLYANVTLHHVILFNGGRPDPVCPRLFGERFFGAGAERWTRRFDGAHGASGAWGYAVRPDDQWDAVFELHNEAPDAVDAFIALRFEWVDAQSAVGRGVRELRVAWLDITGCGNSERPVPTTSEPFAYTTPKWTANVNGTILDVAAHQHNGGVDMSGYRNGREFCRSSQVYDYREGTRHIVATGVCKGAGVISMGDELWGHARYDPTNHKLDMHDGKPNKIMGSMGLYIAID